MTTPLSRHPDDGWMLADPWPMGAGTRRALAGVIRALCPHALADDGLEEVVALHVRRLARYLHPTSAHGLVLTIHLLAWAPLWRFAALRPLHRLPPERGARVLESMAQSRFAAIRMLVVALRGLVLSTYFDQDRVHRAIGYAPVPFLEQRITLRKKIMAGGALVPSDAIGGGS